MSAFAIARAGEADLPELLVLMRQYCAFYEETAGIAQTTDAALEELARTLLADPDREGVQLLARREPDGAAIGFATIYWTWSTLSAARIGVMNDLFVTPAGRGAGVADSLIEACRDAVRAHGGTSLEWQTALDNERAQTVYDRVGGQRSQWLSYSLAVD